MRAVLSKMPDNLLISIALPLTLTETLKHVS